jgi:hypothetical protein
MRWIVLLVFACAAPVFAQDAFNPFGNEDENEGASKPLNVKIGGDIAASLAGYFKDMRDDFGGARAGDMLKAHIGFSASGSGAEALVRLKLAPQWDTNISPVSVDEAYMTVFLNHFDFTAGLRKITWGRADSEGPLDVINPLDLSDLSALSEGTIPRIARPLLRLSLGIGAYSKLEAVFVPWFEGHRFAETGRWKPVFISETKDRLASIGIPVNKENDTQTFAHFQTGARFTTTLGHTDAGLQYYYGFLPRPAYRLEYRNSSLPLPSGISPVHNRYHQIGADMAAGLAGFNVRAETALNITDDTAGNDPSVYNPALLFSLGFDRGFFGFDLNLQCSEKIRLFNDGVGKKILGMETDIEGGKPATFTRITTELSRAFFRDTLRLQFMCLWDIEDGDALLMPRVICAAGDAELEFASGFFVGNTGGEFGQYHDNGFVKALVRWTF